ncbi:MAG: hypothetical protein KIG16_02165 [Eubacteriales bacterium]|nr:hypothetical protein [Eubacteriales bacterium]
MEKTTSVKPKRKSNPMQKVGQTIKDTFMEMSTSLAGWIDDTSDQFSAKPPKKTSVSGAKFVSTPKKTN